MSYKGNGVKSTSINGVPMYTLTSQDPSPATWLASKKKRGARKVQNHMQSVELIQDLRFETATSKIKATPDGEYLIASGIYPPQVKVYEVNQHALKFERHLVSEIVDFEVLGDDYSKLAFLCADRSVNLHAKYGKHYTMRIPRMGRDMAYDSWSCDLFCAASSPDVYRINLEQGRFLSSLNTQSPALNVVSRSKLHGLVACGGEDGAVECFDMRARSSVGRINAVAPTGDIDQEVTSVEFDEDSGFLMAVGSSEGKVLIYDMRSSIPLRIKDHMYGSPILDIKWHRTLNAEHPHLITTDKHVVRIWDPETGEGMTSIEPTAGAINDLCVFNNSGLIMLALDCNIIPSYFIPALGPAPKWCSHLENITEELEEGAQATIYDNFKFLTKEDLEKLNLTNLIGTNLLRAYMHGFFMDYRLYMKAKALANPFAYDDFIEQKKQEKLEAQRASRITIRKRLPKVNRTLAARLLEDEEAEKETVEEKKEPTEIEVKKSKKKKGLSTEVLKDDRFKGIFENKDFEIDEESAEYVALHPMPSQKPSLVEEHFEPVLEDENEGRSDSDAQLSDDDADGPTNKRARGPRLYEVKDERHAEAFWNRVSLANEDSLPMGERAAALRDHKRPYGTPKDVKLGPGGSREISFVSRSSGKYNDDEVDDDGFRKKRRGVQSLGLKQDRSEFQGRGRGRGGRGRGGGRGGSRGRGGRGGRGRGRN